VIGEDGARRHYLLVEEAVLAVAAEDDKPVVTYFNYLQPLDDVLKGVFDSLPSYRILDVRSGNTLPKQSIGYFRWERTGWHIH
jgi:hypothetical protein